MLKYTSLLFKLIAATAFTLCAPAQSISFGIKGGVPLISSANSNDESHRYLVGPSIELRLPANFAVEVDALYQRTGSSYSYGIGDFAQGVPTQVYYSASSERQRGNYWQFPILGKYYLKSAGSAWRPFVATGYAAGETWLNTKTQAAYVDNTGTSQLFSSDYSSRTGMNVGAVFAVGLRYKAGKIAIVPEVRYTRWGNTDASTTRKNQAAFFLGIQF